MADTSPSASDSAAAVVTTLRFPKTPKAFSEALRAACAKGMADRPDSGYEAEQMISLGVVEKVAHELGIHEPPQPWSYDRERFPVWDFLIRYSYRSQSFWGCAGFTERVADARRAVQIFLDRRLLGT